jgi:hypothetical protein
MALLGGVVDLTCHKMLIPQRYFGITQPVQGFLEQTQLCMHDIRAVQASTCQPLHLCTNSYRSPAPTATISGQGAQSGSASCSASGTHEVCKT